MGSNVVGQIVTVFTAIVGVAILAVLVSKNAQTPQVIQSAFGGLATALKAATGPVTGGGGYSLPNLQSFGAIGQF